MVSEQLVVVVYVSTVVTTGTVDGGGVEDDSGFDSDGL